MKCQIDNSQSRIDHFVWKAHIIHLPCAGHVVIFDNTMMAHPIVMRRPSRYARLISTVTVEYMLADYGDSTHYVPASLSAFKAEWFNSIAGMI